MLLLSQNNATAATGSRRIALPNLVCMQQPQSSVSIKPEFSRGLVIAYAPQVFALASFAGSAAALTTGKVPTIKAGVIGQSAYFTSATSTPMVFPNTAAAPSSGGFTILSVARRSVSNNIQGVFSRSFGGQAGGIELTLANSFGTPPTQLYCSYYKVGVGQSSLEGLYVNGTPSGGSGYDTLSDKYYAICGRAESVGACTQDMGIGAVTTYGMDGDIALVMVWDAKFPDALLLSLSLNPWQVFR